MLVVCAGGGGIPVVATATADLRGVEAVVDKDLRRRAARRRRCGADALLLLTDVAAVRGRLRHAVSARRLDVATPAELRRSSFAAGSMGPKVEAAARFVEATGGRAVIGALKHAASLMAGSEGTKVTPSRSLVARST